MHESAPRRPPGLEAWFQAALPDTESWVHTQIGHPLRQRVVAADVVQDAAIRLLNYSKISQIRTYNEFRKLFRRICLNTLRDLADYHTYKRRSINNEVQLSAAGHVELSALRPDLAAESAEEAAFVRLSLEQLPARDRSVILLSQWTGFSYPEVGRCLDISPDAARVRYSRAMVRLTALLVKLKRG